jgi:hypothetical protein
MSQAIFWACVMETAERLEPANEVVGCREVGEMHPWLVMALVVEAFDGRFFDGPNHLLDLPALVRLRHFATVLRIIPNSRLSGASEACNRCIAA